MKNRTSEVRADDGYHSLGHEDMGLCAWPIWMYFFFCGVNPSKEDLESGHADHKNKKAR